MSSTESSGAPAEASATTPAPAAAFPSFGSTRGSGLARGKRPSTGPVAAASAASTEYTPTAIEVVSVPREYQNPFAPVETPASVTAGQPAPSTPPPAISAPAAEARPEPVERAAPVEATPARPGPVERTDEVSAPVNIAAHETAATDEQAELNILPPEQQKTVPAQTWESEGFRPAREPRTDRPRREESRHEERPERAPRPESAPFDPATIPAKFLYVRPGYNYVPTPSNYSGAPRDRESGPVAARPFAATAAPAAQKSGGFLGWLKSLFGSSSPAPAPVEARIGDERNGDRHRGGRGRGPGGGDSHRRRSRGGRGRNRGEYRSGGDQGGSAAT